MATADIPAHVPASLVRDFDFDRDLHPGDVYANAYRHLHDGPDIFYTPCQGGHWVLTRYEDMEYAMKTADEFASGLMIVPKVEKPFQLLPVEANPPLHADYRAILQPYFSPKKISDLENKACELTLALIEDFYAKGECEFVSEFALKMPTGIFMSLLDLPDSEADFLVPLVEKYIHGATAEIQQAAFAEMLAYVGRKIEERRVNPGDDMLSALLKAKIDGGRPMTEGEIFGSGVLLLIAGLETVASGLSMIAGFFARHEDYRRQVLDDPELISNAIEELLRRFHPNLHARVVAHDLVYKGITMKEGDIVISLQTLAGLDERRYPDPFKVDFMRADKKHLAFGVGPHTCIGSFLARTELRVFLTEWLKRIPKYSLKPGTEPVIGKGFGHSALSLHLQWQP